MITLYDNPFSPFARKVRLVLEHKGLAFERIDALALRHHDKLLRVNPRGEVPVLDDEGFIVVNSSDIVAYLEDCHPTPAILPKDAKRRASARAWERCADTLLDAIIHDISIWYWPTHNRKDTPPDGLLNRGRADLMTIVDSLESSLGDAGFLCGELTIADLAVFPHLSSLKGLGITLDPATHPRVSTWMRRMRAIPCVRTDLEYVKRMVAERFGAGPSPYEGDKIIWRGDRIEWLFANGFHEWWLAELDAGRVIVPRSTHPRARG